MKQTLVLLLLLFSALQGEAQSIRYDTIRVAADDERNIYRAGAKLPHRTEPLNVTGNQTIRVISAVRPQEASICADLGLSLSRNYTSGHLPQVGYQLNQYLLAEQVSVLLYAYNHEAMN